MAQRDDGGPAFPVVTASIHDFPDGAQAALSALGPDYAVLPVNPTEAMLNAGAAVCYEDDERLRETWTAMISAYTASRQENPDNG